MRSRSALALLVVTILTASPSFASEERKTIQVMSGDSLLEFSIPDEEPTPAPAAPNDEAPSPEPESTPLTLSPVTVNEGGKTAEVPGSYRLRSDSWEALPPLKTNRKLKQVSGDLEEGSSLILLEKRKTPKAKKGAASGGNGGNGGNGNNTSTDNPEAQFDLCDTIDVSEDTIRPALVRCGDSYLVNGGVLALRTKNGIYPLARVPNRKAPTWGTDAGIALTIVKGSDTEEGYEFFEGATAYYSIARLGSFLRAMTSLAALDMSADQDFETGLGFGIMLRGPDAGEDNQGFSLLTGIGYNFMLDGADDPDPWYYYIGFGWNFGRGQ